MRPADRAPKLVAAGQAHDVRKQLIQTAFRYPRGGALANTVAHYGP